MKTKVQTKKFIALLLIFALLAPAVPAGSLSVGSFGTVLYEKPLIIGNDTVYYDLTTNHSEQGRLQSHVVEYTPSSLISPVVFYGSKLYGTSTITTATKNLEAQGSRVIAGINADYFSFETGLPMGIVINNGRLASSDDGRIAVGFNRDGTAFIGRPELKFNLELPSGDKVYIDHFNKWRTTSGVYLLNSDFSENTRNKTRGYDIYLRPIGNANFKPGGVVDFVVENIDISDGAVPIESGVFILTVDELGPVDRIAAIRKEDKVRLTIETSDPKWGEAAYAAGGAELLISGGIVQSNFERAVHPRSAVGIKADGTVVLIETDGRQSGYSAGITLQTLAAQMYELGCVEAINLDGGGSSAFTLRYPGFAESQVVSSPSGGSLRGCANYIFLVNNQAVVSEASKLLAYPYEDPILAGSIISFDIKPIGANYLLANMPKEYVTYLEGSAGKIEADGRFYAASSAAEGTLNMRKDFEISTQKLKIIDKIDEIRIFEKDKTLQINTRSMKPGESITFEPKAYLNTRQIVSSIEAYAVSADPQIGTIDSTGLFTADGEIGASGLVTLSFGNTRAQVRVTIGRQASLVEDFENNEAMWSVSGGEGAKYAAFGFTKNDLTKVKSGRQAGRITYDFTGAVPESMMALVSAGKPVNFAESPDYINLWVYGDGSKNSVELSYKNSLGGTASFTLLQSLDYTGWRLASAAAPLGLVSISGISVVKTQEGASSGEVLVDQMTGSYYGPITDTMPPSVNIKWPGNGVVITELPAVISAEVYDNMSEIVKRRVSVFLDGVSVDFTYGAQTQLVEFTLPQDTEQGRHRVTIECGDIAGNISRASVDFIVGRDAAAGTFADMKGHWSEPYVDYSAVMGFVRGIESGSKVLYEPERNMNRAELAVLVTRYLGLDPNTYTEVKLPFADLDKIPEWALPYARAMYAEGIILGRKVNDNTDVFDPLAYVTRAEGAVMLGKLQKQGYAKKDTVFTDMASVADWARPYIEVLLSLDVISGFPDGTVRPSQELKRGEVAKMIYALQ